MATSTRTNIDLAVVEARECPPAVTRRSRRVRLAAALLGVTMLSAACSSTAVSSSETGTTSPTTTASDFSGAVDIGNGRQIYATCQGTGSPTVVLIAGKGNGAEDWQDVLEPGDPAHTAPGDNLPFGMGELVPSDDAVFPSVAGFTRVCTYDRPGVRTDGADVSTPREQPHTVDQDVADLQALMTALDDPGPYVLVAHSYGGLIATLYARTYPESVAGLVMVDTVTELMENIATAAQLKGWSKTNAMTSAQSPEGVELADAFAKINAAQPLPDVPAVVLSADKPWRIDLLPPKVRKIKTVTFDEWLQSLDLLATALHAQHITDTNSGHDIYLYNPAIVVDAIHGVVDDVRSN